MKIFVFSFSKVTELFAATSVEQPVR